MTTNQRSGRLVQYCGVAQTPWSLRSRMGRTRGTCCWCGEIILLSNPHDYRRRQRTRHRGDGHEIGDGRNCHRAFLNSFCWTARELVESRADPCCIYCGEVTAKWEADHQKALALGGGHNVVNIVRSCIPCHRKKTAREARVRATSRRVKLDQGELLWA